MVVTDKHNWRQLLIIIDTIGQSGCHRLPSRQGTNGKNRGHTLTYRTAERRRSPRHTTALSGQKNFLNDLQTWCPLYKYVDDGSIFGVCNLTTNSNLQESIDMANRWTKDNDMRIDGNKTKEMVICFCRNSDHVNDIPNIRIDTLKTMRTNRSIPKCISKNNTSIHRTF